MEGPFGEWTGYYASHVREEPIIRIRRVYFRNDPIMAGAPPSRPPTEATFYKSFWRSAMVWEELERAGVPDVVGVYCPPEGNTRLLTVVAIRQRYPGHARQAGMIASQCHAAAYLGRFTVVVDEDIDPTDMKDVWWAMTTRCDPIEDIRNPAALLGAVRSTQLFKEAKRASIRALSLTLAGPMSGSKISLLP